jgi:putative addiction module CopG family antidote
MPVTLTKDLEKFIARKVGIGGYANASEVVRDALRNFRAKDDPAELDSQELAELLLPAVRGRHRPLTARHFDQLRLCARRMSLILARSEARHPWRPRLAPAAA